MYYNDFKDKQTQNGKIDGNIEQLPKNNRRFLEISNVVTNKNVNHYEVPWIQTEKTSNSQMAKAML